MIELKPGIRLKSAVCDTQIMVVKGKGAHDLRCGGVAMQAFNATGPDVAQLVSDSGFAAGTLMGKRYVNGDGSIEALCTKPGLGSLSLGPKRESALQIKQTEALPASD
ncbi:hypothetical protein [Microbulbifer spongiae]|uniref:Uncharacterized protein n=1 Tax=Microbulbifer spongiae TaxID=2944933 RepID=A0ABY9E8M8_9GAMM|nr:hypothetical protein [Microbulbifer sp. MI-G]WKD49032.1 hypothetical protein M8T91_14175 [Microbulbifer sp. MI-G]